MLLCGTKIDLHYYFSENSNQTPIVVIEFTSLRRWLEQKPMDVICGRRYQIMIKPWENIFIALKNAGCSLVFFAPWYNSDFKLDQKLVNLNQHCRKYADIYNQIECGTVLQDIQIVNTRRIFEATKHSLASTAKDYGELRNAVKEQCHLEIVRYATQHNAMAIISNSTEYLVFDGSWKLWTSYDLKIDQSNRITTTEYEPKCLVSCFEIAKHQLPLFATLLGNEITSKHKDILYDFHKTLGPLKYRLQNVANYVRKVGSIHLSDLDIRRLTQHVFGTADDEMQKLIKQSLNWYDTNTPPIVIDDPIEQKLANTNMYRTYKAILSPIQIVNAQFYDKRSCVDTGNYTELIIDWYKRKVGVVRQQRIDDNFTLTFLAKKNSDEGHQAYTDAPIYPDCELNYIFEIFFLYSIVNGSIDFNKYSYFSSSAVFGTSIFGNRDRR